MDYPPLITNLPQADVPIPGATAYLLRSPDGLLVWFHFAEDADLPFHSHDAQWGTVLAGEIELTIDGETRLYRPGDSYFVPAGVEHGARIAAGTQVIDFFAEVERYVPRDA